MQRRWLVWFLPWRSYRWRPASCSCQTPPTSRPGGAALRGPSHVIFQEDLWNASPLPQQSWGLGTALSYTLSTRQISAPRNLLSRPNPTQGRTHTSCEPVSAAQPTRRQQKATIRDLPPPLFQKMGGRRSAGVGRAGPGVSWHKPRDTPLGRPRTRELEEEGASYPSFHRRGQSLQNLPLCICWLFYTQFENQNG